MQRDWEVTEMSDCNIIRDLLPAYISSACHKDTYALVEEHLKKCEGCRKEYELMLLLEEEFADTEERIFKQGVKEIEKKAEKRLLNREICQDFLLNMVMVAEFFFLIKKGVGEITIDVLMAEMFFLSVPVLIILPFLFAEIYYMMMYVMKKDVGISETLARASMVAKCGALLFFMLSDI